MPPDGSNPCKKNLAALEANGTWVIVPTPKNEPIITAKWVYQN